MSKELAQAAKARGNAAFTKGDFETAIKEFSEAIAQDPTDAVFFSNRSGAYASLKQFDKALEDAQQCVALKPEFVKGYSRQGVALFGLNKLEEAKRAYEEGLKVDPNAAALKEGLADVEARLRQPPPQQGNPLGSLFGPDMFVKLNANPTTREYMSDPAFVQKLQMLQSNPSQMGAVMADPRMAKALSVLLGVDISAMGGAGAGAEEDEPMPTPTSSASTSSSGVQVEDEEMEDKPKRTFKQTGEMSFEEAKAAGINLQSLPKQPEPEPELSEEEKAERKRLTEEKAAKAKARAEADKEKAKGNDAYKKRDFATAISHYEKALEIDPTNIVYYNNLSAVYVEQKDHKKAIEVALKGVEVGRAQMADYKDLGKALARIAAAHQALGELDQAIEYYNKALLEDYSDKTKNALKKLEADKKKKEEEAYINPELSEEHKQKGNQLYNDGKFREAIAEYTEAIKRDPKNYKVYSNRAACYTKLMDWGRGLEDCEKCLSVDPKFIKAYIRKGKIQHFLKQYHKALSTYDQALEIEPNNMEVMEAKRATMIAIQTSDNDPARAQEAMKDPEIQAILRDPTISKVLQDMQENPQAGAAAMRDTDIRKKIEKLIAAGVLSVK